VGRECETESIRQIEPAKGTINVSQAVQDGMEKGKGGRRLVAIVVKKKTIKSNTGVG